MVCYILLPETEAQQLSAKTSYFPLSLQTSKVKKNNLVDQGATSSSRLCGIFEGHLSSQGETSNAEGDPANTCLPWAWSHS